MEKRIIRRLTGESGLASTLHDKNGFDKFLKGVIKCEERNI